MDSNIKDLMTSTLAKQKAGKGQNEQGIKGQAQNLKNILSGVQSQELFQSIVQAKEDELKQKAAEDQKENDEKLGKKNKIINDLLTESENHKNQVTELKNIINQKKSNEAKLQGELDMAKKQMEAVKVGHVKIEGGL